MRIQAKFAIAVLLCGASTCLSPAQEEDYRQSKTSNTDVQNTATNHSRDNDRALNEDDRLSLLAAALDARVRRSERDCSHLVHAIYQRAGFAYRYAPSSEIYAGIEGFQRIKQPQPGDLVVWRGHVGIVIKPSQHIFFSLMRSGPGTDDYEAAYWKGRGRPRFYRYVKSDFCAGCDSVRAGSRRLVKIKR
jgi:cell wall-associated NlpC family hydrolase